jgi:hypothetical protein
MSTSGTTQQYAIGSDDEVKEERGAATKSSTFRINTEILRMLIHFLSERSAKDRSINQLKFITKCVQEEINDFAEISGVTSFKPQRYQELTKLIAEAAKKTITLPHNSKDRLGLTQSMFKSLFLVQQGQKSVIDLVPLSDKDLLSLPKNEAVFKYFGITKSNRFNIALTAEKRPIRIDLTEADEDAWVLGILDDLLEYYRTERLYFATYYF